MSITQKNSFKFILCSLRWHYPDQVQWSEDSSSLSAVSTAPMFVFHYTPVLHKKQEISNYLTFFCLRHHKPPAITSPGTKANKAISHGYLLISKRKQIKIPGIRKTFGPIQPYKDCSSVGKRKKLWVVSLLIKQSQYIVFHDFLSLLACFQLNGSFSQEGPFCFSRNDSCKNNNATNNHLRRKRIT